MLEPEFTPQIALAVIAHPDDLDFFAGGTAAKWAAAGTKIYLLVLTDGGRGTADPSVSASSLIHTRREEQRQAAHTLGITQVWFEDFADGELANTADVRRSIVRRIRETRPDVVIGWDPQLFYSAEHQYLNHADHRAAGAATLDAVWPEARNLAAYPELLPQKLEPFAVPRLMFMTLSEPNYISDVTNWLDAKRTAMAAHLSQNERISAFEKRELYFGKKGGFLHGEAFIMITIPN